MVCLSLGMFLFRFESIFLILAFSSITLAVTGYLRIPPEDGSIEIERDRKEVHTYQGEKFTVGLTVRNESRSEIYLEIKDELPKNVKLVEGTNHRFLHLEGKEQKKIEYKIEFLKPENYTLGPTKTRYIDPLKFFSKEWEFDEITNVIALPPMEDLGRSKLRPQQTKGWLGNIKSSQMGIGSEFYSIREYVEGDEMRNINWKATARFLDPKSNSYHAEKSGDVVIIVDAFYESNVGVFEDNMLKYSAKAATSLASDIISDRNRVGLVVIGDHVRWVYPRSGQEQLYKIMKNLMDVEGGSYWRYEHAKFILDQIFPNKMLLLFITPLISDNVIETIVALGRKKYEIAVLSPSPIELQKKYLEQSDETAERLQRIERGTRMNLLRKYGPVIDWSIGQPLEAAVEGVKRYQMRS